MKPWNPLAFTVIELLVVITVIVVIVALLTPALDRAIYQAELALCATKLHAVGLGAQTYAMDHRRWYPHRYLHDGAGFSPGEMDVLFIPPPLVPLEYDLRKMLAGYISINAMLNDPMVKAVDLETSHESWCFNSYSLYFGIRFRPAAGAVSAMRKLGDRWGLRSPDDGVTRQFSVLAVDEDQIAANDNVVSTAHPDADGKLTNVVWEGVLLTGMGPSPLPTIPGLANAEFILSKWAGPPQRGTIDMNAAMEDGSVERMLRTPWNAWAVDDRFTRVPADANSDSALEKYVNVPIR